MAYYGGYGPQNRGTVQSPYYGYRAQPFRPVPYGTGGYNPYAPQNQGAYGWAPGGQQGGYAPPAQWGGQVPPGQFVPPGGGGPGPIDLSHLDYSNDPILARVKALAAQRVSDAEANALAAKQKLVVGYGDAGLAQKLKLGDSYATAAAQNPFSTVAELGRTYTRRNVFDINRPLSDYKNLFYSSERGRELALSGEQNLRDQSTAERAVQDQLAQIAEAVTQAKLQAQAEQIQAEQDAYQRALQAALSGGGY